MKRPFYIFLSFLITLYSIGLPLENNVTRHSFIAPKTALQLPAFVPMERPFVEDALTIVEISPELASTNKGGGMANVAEELGLALRKAGHNQIGLFSLYLKSPKDAQTLKERGITWKEAVIEDLGLKEDGTLKFYVGSELVEVGVLKGKLNEMPVYFFTHDHYFRKLYDFHKEEGDSYLDGIYKFKISIVLSRAAAELLKRERIHPDIIQTHDWVPALTPVFLKADPAFANDPLFTDLETGLPRFGTHHIFHNKGWEYQGRFLFEMGDVNLFEMLNLDMKHIFGLRSFTYEFWYMFRKQILKHPEIAEKIRMNLPLSVQEKAQFDFGSMVEKFRERYPGRKVWEINLTAAVMGHYADKITTVSNTFAEESKEEAHSMEFYLRRRAAEGDYFGIVNGTDVSEWVRTLDKKEGKKKAREDLIENFGLNKNLNGPIIGIMSRFAQQKGIHVLSEELEAILKEDPSLRFVLVGSPAAGDPEGEKILETFTRLEKEYPGRVTYRGFDSKWPKIVLPGLDIVVLPSNYEPCGLVQLEAMAVGTVPIVHATGGLVDTVPDFEPEWGEGPGFQFSIDKSLLEKDEIEEEGASVAALERRAKRIETKKVAAMRKQLAAAIRRASKIYRENKPLWWRLVGNAKRQARVFTWDRARSEYLELYRELLGLDSVSTLHAEESSASNLLYDFSTSENNPVALDEWDVRHFTRTWDPGSQRWRAQSKKFPNLILGTWEDIEFDEQGHLKKDVAIRMRPGWTLYVVESVESRLKYIKEDAIPRGEVPRNGNDHIFLNEKPQVRQNTLLAADDLIWRHFWLNGKNVSRLEPLGGKVQFFGGNPVNFFEEMVWRPKKSALIQIGPNPGVTPGKVLGFLDRLDTEGLVPHAIVLTANRKNNFDYRKLAEEVSDLFTEENLLASLQRKASFGHWNNVFNRLLKMNPGRKEKVVLSFDRGEKGIHPVTIDLPEVLLEEDQLYLTARYLAARVYNRSVTEGAEKIGFWVEGKKNEEDQWLENQLFQYLRAELDAFYKKPLQQLGVFEGEIPLELARWESRTADVSKRPRKIQHVSSGLTLGVHVGSSSIKVVLLQNDSPVYYDRFETNTENGSSLKGQVLSIVENAIRRAEMMGSQRLDSIGISFAGPVKNEELIKMTNIDRFNVHDYRELNTLKHEFKRRYEVKKVTVINGANAHGFAEIIKRNGRLTDISKAVFTVGTGVGYAKISNGVLEEIPNEGGHLVVRIANPDVKHQMYGVQGDLEEYLSVRGMIRRAKKLGFEWIGPENSFKEIAELAVEAEAALKHFIEQKKGDSDQGIPIDLNSRVMPKDQSIAYQLLYDIADIYADAIAEVHRITGITQFIFAGDLMQDEAGALLRKFIRNALQVRYPKLGSIPGVIVEGQADLSYGKAIGAAQFALSLTNGKTGEFEEAAFWQDQIESAI